MNTATEEELRKRFPNAPESFIKRNAGILQSPSAIGALGRLVDRVEKIVTLTPAPSPARQIRTVREEKPGGATSVSPEPETLPNAPFAFSTDNEPAALLYFTRFVPVKVLSEANICGEHWTKKQKRVRDQREAVHLWLRNLKGKSKPSAIYLQRVNPRKLDGDNLQNAFKHIRDEIAALLDFDDRDESVRWYYDQKPILGRESRGFNVSIAWRGAPMCPHCGKQP